MMGLLGNLFLGLYKITDIALNLYIGIIIVRAIITHIDVDPYHFLVRFLESITEPVLEPIRKKLPTYHGGHDLSPVFLIVGIFLIKILIVKGILLNLAEYFGW